MKSKITISFILFLFIAIHTTTQAGNTIYVDASRTTGGNNGASWTNAFTSLQPALSIATSGDQIWVAKGTYKPTGEVGGTGTRFKTFQMKNGVAIYGGFAGTENALSQRLDFGIGSTNETILSGDLNDDDVVTGNGETLSITQNNDNSYSVLCNSFSVGNPLTASAILDGFTITGGNSNATVASIGGGMYNYYSSPTLSNITFTANSAADAGGGMNNVYSSPILNNVTFYSNMAYRGGGMSNYESFASLTDVSFISNSVSSDGGGMYNFMASPTMTNAKFISNSAVLGGGGMYNWGAPSINIKDATFTSNLASEGGGILNFNSHVTINKSIFSENSATKKGGAISNNNGIVNGIKNTAYSSLCNVLIAFNSAQDGGGIYNGFSNPTFTNVTFSSNAASNYGGGIYDDHSSPILNNSIIWGNSASSKGNELYNIGGTTTLNYCCYGNGTKNVFGMLNVSNCITTDPRFVDVEHGDFRLFSNSICVDKGNNNYVQTLNPVVDIDLRGQIRIQNNIIDLGAYEWTNGVDPVCVNPTDGGTIISDQTGCSPFDPDEIISSGLPTGYTGTLEYKWQSSVTSSSAGFIDIAGSNAATCNPGLLTQTTWYKRLARVECMADWTGAAESNVVVMKVNALPSAPLAGTNTFIYDGKEKTASVIVGTEDTIYWYDAVNGGNTITAPTETFVGKYYAWAEAINTTTGCISDTSTMITLDIEKATLIVTAENKAIVYGQSLPEFTFSITGYVNSETDTVLTSYPKATVADDEGINAGIYTITPSGGTAENYAFEYMIGELRVEKAILTVTADDKESIEGTIPELTFNYLGFINGDSIASIDHAPIAATGASEASPAGTYPITVSGGTDNNYTFTYFDGKLTLKGKSVASINWNDPATITYGTAIGTGQLNAIANISGAFDYIPSMGTVLNAGNAQSLKVKFTPTDGKQYAVSEKTVYINVEKAPLTVTADNMIMKAGAEVPEFTVVYSGFVNGDNEEDVDTKPVAATIATSASGKGEYEIVVDGGADNNYSFVYKNGKLTIESGTAAKIMESVSLKVYPNPFVDKVFISSDYSGEGSYLLSDLSGNTIRNGNIENGSTQLTLSQLRSGIYLLQVKLGEEEMSLRLVKP